MKRRILDTRWQILDSSSPETRILHLASSIQKPVSSIQYPASSIQYPASSFQHPASRIQYPESSIFITTMYIKIHFNDKPLFLCDNLDEFIEPYVHHDDAVFIDELDNHTVKAMI